MKTVFILLLLLGAGGAAAQERSALRPDSVLRGLAAYEEGRKDPFVAFTWSLFLPGGGFFYLGDAGQGMACLGIEGATVLWAVDMADLHPGNIAPYLLAAVERAVELLLAVTETNRRNGLLREGLGLQAGLDWRRGATLSLRYDF